MVKDTNSPRRDIAQRIRESTKKPRKGLAERIRESNGKPEAHWEDQAAAELSVVAAPPESQETPVVPMPPDDVSVPAGDQATDPDPAATDIQSDVEIPTEANGTTGTVPEKHGVNSIVAFLHSKRQNPYWSAIERFCIKLGRDIIYNPLARYIRSLFSAQSHHTEAIDPQNLKSATRKAYGYAEAHRLREQITNELKEKGQKALVLTSPHPGTGNTFLTAVMALNAVHFSSMNVLIIDMNMREPQMHSAFDLTLSNGFTDIVKGQRRWEDTVKRTDFNQLYVITAGEFDFELARHLNRPNIEELIDGVKSEYDFIVIDTSPVLSVNRNNVDPSLLSLVCDKVLVSIQGKKTTKAELEETFTAITKGGGTVDGIVYNRQFSRQ